MRNQTEIGAFIIIGCLVMFILVVVIIFYVLNYQRRMLAKQNKVQQLIRENQLELFKATVEVEERQKEKIANNLHDGINPLLTSLKLSLSAHQLNFRKNNFIDKDLDKDKRLIDQIIDDIRSTCYDLTPNLLHEYGLIESLKEFIETVNNAGTIKAKFNSDTESNNFTNISAQNQLNIYRICQEILNNILKHTKCSEINLSIFIELNIMKIQFVHNGNGISNHDIELLSTKGVGLNSLKSRALLLNGNIDYSVEENTSSVKLQIPIMV